MRNLVRKSMFRNQVTVFLILTLVLLSIALSVPASAKTLTLWGKQTKGWGMKNAETKGNRLTLVRPATIVSVRGNSDDYCIWSAVTPTNHTARSVICGGRNRPNIIGRVLQPGTYTVLPEAGTSVTISLTYQGGGPQIPPQTNQSLPGMAGGGNQPQKTPSTPGLSGTGSANSLTPSLNNLTGRLVSGIYRVTQGRWRSTWTLRVVNGQIRGTSEWTCCPGHRIDPIKGRISGNTVVMERDCSGQGWNGACRQIFRGHIQGDRIEGTCSGTGLYSGSLQKWVLYLNGGAGTQNQTPQNVPGTAIGGQQPQSQNTGSTSGQLPGSAKGTTKSYNGIKFPLGDKSFADRVVVFKPGQGTGERDGSAAVGPPDGGKGTGPSSIGAKGDVSLGRGGSIVLEFTDNYLVDVKGLDLYVYEFGPDVEPFKVEISKDGLNWINLGTVRGQPTGLDIHNKVAPGDKFSYVRITDANPYIPRDSKTIGKPQYVGADIDAVGAIGAEEKHDSVISGGLKGTSGAQNQTSSSTQGPLKITGMATKGSVQKANANPTTGKSYFVVTPAPYVTGKAIDFQAVNIPASGIQYWVVKYKGNVRKISKRTSHLSYVAKGPGRYGIAIVYFKSPNDRSLHSLTRWVTVRKKGTGEPQNVPGRLVFATPYIRSTCSPQAALIQVPNGFVARDFRIRTLEIGTGQCTLVGRQFFTGTGFAIYDLKGREFFRLESKNGAAWQASPVSLEALVLAPGRYRVEVGPGKNAYLKLAYHIVASAPGGTQQPSGQPSGTKQTNGKPSKPVTNTQGTGGNTGQANNTVNQPTSNPSTSSVASKGKTLTLWGEQTKGWGMKNAETKGNRLTLVRPATIIKIKGDSQDYCIWSAVTPTNHTARSVVCGGRNRPNIIGQILQPGTYTVIPAAGTSVTIELRYLSGTGNGIETGAGIGTGGSSASTPPGGGHNGKQHPQQGNQISGDQKPEYHVVIRPQKTPTATSLTMKTGDERRFITWLEDAAGYKKSVTVKEWKVDNKKVGSINRDGVFKAGPQEGNVAITANVINQKGKILQGTFLVAVTSVAPITFSGRVKFYDENGNRVRVPGGGVNVHIGGAWFKDENEYKKAHAAQAVYGKNLGHIKTDHTGRFQFTLASGGFMWIYCDINGLYIPAPAGYEWLGWPPSPKNTNIMCNEGDWDGLLLPGKSVWIAPKNMKYFKLWLTKRTNYIFITGVITHHGKPVNDAHVKLINDYDKVVKESWSGYDGSYSLAVDSLPSGNYILKADYKSKTHVTLKNWLTMKKGIRIALPLKGTHTNIDGDEVKIINIDLSSQADKMGYTGP